ncbi:LysE family translocator [Acinetobacter stercoris]|uniref:Threonine efflux protein n=1 Tax=Acinetobacter stercoris TaxID=2126983 RepID=A0A2U3MYV5_9GAMM|nr:MULTISPECIES: LysE family translocator [Acinetobacter]SPL70622.1 Threonine efflux protein [Acinetobacter stercoris]
MELFFAVALTHFLALLSPGPDFFLILSTLLRQGTRSARWVCLGIASGNALILAFVYISFFTLGKINQELLNYLRYFGAIYLFYLCGLCFYHAKHTNMEVVSVTQDQMSSVSSYKGYLSGLQSSILNPKNILFYSSLVILISAQFSLIEKLLSSLWMVSVVLCWNLFLIHILSQKKMLQWMQKKSRSISYLSGLSFLLFAFLLLFF